MGLKKPNPGPKVVHYETTKVSSPTPMPIADAKEQETPKEKRSLFNGGIQTIEVTRKPLDFDNPVEFLMFIKPTVRPYKWQFEELMRIGGYLENGKYLPRDKVKITKDNPYRLLLSAANGSGKDAIIIAAAATWYAVTGIRNRAIITSSSFEQIKFQTEPAIRDLINCTNRKFPGLFKSVQFHHVVPELGSEIKMFATDDPGHAEGYHAWDAGGVMRIVNEAKSVEQDIFKAMSRWTGVTHDLCVSSPGKKSGVMYNRVADAIIYPNPPVLGKWFLRKVTAFECPHLTAAHIEGIIAEYGIDSPHTRSVIFAEFSDYDEPIIISEAFYDKCYSAKTAEVGNDIGIGLDLAGGGDEDACFVRRGNRVIHKFFFRQRDTDLAADLIDIQLAPWKGTDYVFNADNGGIGQAILDKLAAKGWRISRRNNQSPAFDKRQFLNLGAEVWHHVKRLVERCDIILPKGVDKLREQMTTRQWTGLDTTQGKFALEPKPTAIASGRPSPDRADAFNLCFFSYRPLLRAQEAEKKDGIRYLTAEELLIAAHNGSLWRTNVQHNGRHTTMNSTHI